MKGGKTMNLIEDKRESVKLSRRVNTTLDGEPAVVCGASNRWATVAQINGPLELEFSWEAVKRILDKDGKFSS